MIEGHQTLLVLPKLQFQVSCFESEARVLRRLRQSLSAVEKRMNMSNRFTRMAASPQRERHAAHRSHLPVEIVDPAEKSAGLFGRPAGIHVPPLCEECLRQTVKRRSLQANVLDLARQVGGQPEVTLCFRVGKEAARTIPR